MQRVYAGRWVKSRGDRLYTLSFYTAEQSRLGLNLPLHWRTHTLGVSRKPNPILFQGLGHPNPNHKLLYDRSILCPKTLVGSVRSLKTLLKYSLFYYILELYSTFSHCWAIAILITVLKFTLSSYTAEQFPFSIHCGAIPYPNTMLRFSELYYIADVNPISLYCRAIANANTVLAYSQH